MIKSDFVMKTKYLFTLLFTITMLSCRTQNGRVVTEKFDNGKPKAGRWFAVEHGDTLFSREVQYHSNGEKSLEGALTAAGERDSTWTAWREDGKLWSQTTYTNGKENGVSVAYYPNGQKYYEGRYVNGRRAGIWLFYDETGREVNRQDFGKPLE